jgi:cytochrome c oxidase subunit 2
MKRWFSILLLVALVVTVACGDDDDDDDDGGGTTAPTATTAGGTTGGATATTGGTTGGNGEGDAAAGQAVYQTNCVTCHTIDGGQGVGPTWQGLYGHEVELESGETVTADDAYIRESILQPNAKVVKGFPPAMPTFQGVLTDDQITNVIAYIKTLE